MRRPGPRRSWSATSSSGHSAVRAAAGGPATEPPGAGAKAAACVAGERQRHSPAVSDAHQVGGVVVTDEAPARRRCRVPGPWVRPAQLGDARVVDLQRHAVEPIDAPQVKGVLDDSAVADGDHRGALVLGRQPGQRGAHAGAEVGPRLTAGKGRRRRVTLGRRPALFELLVPETVGLPRVPLPQVVFLQHGQTPQRGRDPLGRLDRPRQSRGVERHGVGDLTGAGQPRGERVGLAPTELGETGAAEGTSHDPVDGGLSLAVANEHQPRHRHWVAMRRRSRKARMAAVSPSIVTISSGRRPHSHSSNDSGSPVTDALAGPSS